MDGEKKVVGWKKENEAPKLFARNFDVSISKAAKRLKLSTTASTMQSGEELAFFKGHSSALASIPISFPDDYQPALADIPKKVQVFPVSTYSTPSTDKI